MIWRVRTTRVEIVICVLLLTMTIFNHRTTLAYGERIECTLYEAIRNDYVIALIEGAYSGYEESFDLTNGYGVFYGPCISVWVSSLVDETLVITVKLGRYLIPDDYDVQNMMITKEYTFTLEAYENTTLTLYAMCIEMHDYVPSEGEFFDLGSLATGYLYDLVCEIEDNYAQDAAGQAAIWAITDHATEEDLREMGADTYVLKRAQALLDDADVPYLSLIHI